MSDAPQLEILVDADACPVKEETYKVAFRHGAPVWLVANSWFRVPDHPLVNRVVVDDGFDAADDYIADRAGPKSLVITADILLADRVIKTGAKALKPNGEAFTAANIGGKIATRAIMADLRAGAVGENIGGPPPFGKKDRSRYLEALHTTLEKMKRER